MLENAGRGIKTNTQGLCVPTETVCTGWGELSESWATTGPDPDSPWSGWRGGLYEKTGPPLYGVEGLSRRNFSKRESEKRDTVLLFGEFS